MIKLVAVVLILASLDQAKSVLRPDCVQPGTDNGASYRGDVAVTKDGNVCQRWDSKYLGTSLYPDKYPDAGLDENYCRNPDSDSGPWCFITEGTNSRMECGWRLPTCTASCSKPIIENGMVSPDRLAIESGATYSVTCDATFEISGSPTINCEGNQLSELPTCETVSENDGNDNGETDGNDNGETENTNNQDYSGAGYTNISTILFGTLMCKIVLIY